MLNIHLQKSDSATSRQCGLFLDNQQQHGEHHLWHGLDPHRRAADRQRGDTSSMPTCFKASIVTQSVGVIASRTLLPSSDAQGGKREHVAPAHSTTHMPMTHPPSTATPLLAHKCVLSITCQMSHKSQKHAYCTNAHAPSCVASGLLIPLIEYYQPKVENRENDRLETSYPLKA